MRAHDGQARLSTCDCQGVRRIPDGAGSLRHPPAHPRTGCRRSRGHAKPWCCGRRGRRWRQYFSRRQGLRTGDPARDGRYDGMLATVMNALALETAIDKAGAKVRTMSAMAMPEICETYERRRALRHLAGNRVVLFAGGTGNPFFTTDTTAVLRAAEIGAHAVLKATDVDGIYSADPTKDQNAIRYDRLTHS